jgi:hypothetical protein
MDTWAPDENPILIRHVHTRLQRGGALVTAGIVAIACLGILVVGSMIADNNRTPPEQAARVMFFVVLAVPGILLLFGGAHRVSLAISMERASGVLETLRLTPMHPGVGLAGYLLGPPLQEIVASLAAIPFLAYCVLRGGVPFVEAFQYAVTIGSTALLFYLMAAVSALSGAAGQPQKRSGLAVGFFVLIFVVPNLIRVSGVFARGGPGSEASVTFFGVGLPLFFHALIWQGALIAFLAIGAARKLAREGAPALSKRQAVLFHATLHVLLLGTMWDGLMKTTRLAAGTGGPVNAFSGWLIGVTIGGGLTGLWLISLMVPAPLAYLRELERARARTAAPRAGSEGASQVRWGLALAGISAAFLLVPVALLLGTGTPPAAIGLPVFLPPVLLAAVILHVGASREALTLRYRKHGGSAHLLLQTALWLLPPILGSIVGVAGEHPLAGGLIASPSPVAGFTAAFVWIGGSPQSLFGATPHVAATASLAVQIALAVFCVHRLRRVHRRIAEQGLYRATPQTAEAPEAPAAGG